LQGQRDYRKDILQKCAVGAYGSALSGNIRELKNMVERLAIMSPGNEITEADIRALAEIKDDPAAGIFARPMPLSAGPGRVGKAVRENPA